MQQDFQGKRVLIVEDDYLVATDLANAFLAANARVLGPYPNLAAAADGEGRADLAILDVDLAGQTVFPLADRLIRAGIPIVFYTGFDPTLLPPRFADISCLNKPLSPQAMVATLARSRLAAPRSIADLIPQLRLHARSLLEDPGAADRLLERALRQAVDSPSPLPPPGKVGPWLEGMMDRILSAERSNLLN
jgi:DNA-binding NtrC family response regulator